MTPDHTTSTYDVVVIGSGAGGLSAAVAAADGGASVLVVEKADTCGGATAWSGGWMWAPRNLFAQADGVNEDRSLPRTYLEHRLGENFDAAKVDALLDGAPEMVEFFETKTALQFVPGAKIADIHGDTPGAGTGHRSVGPKPVNLRKLGPDVAALLRRQLYETSFLGMGIMAGPDLRPSCTRPVRRRLSRTAPEGCPRTCSTSPPHAAASNSSTAPRSSVGFCGQRSTPASRSA